MTRRGLWTLPAALLLAAAGCATQRTASAPANCELEQPPANAGEMAFEGTITKIYPRTPAIRGRYTGCQKIWVQPGWDPPARLLAEIRFERGKPVRYTSFEAGAPRVCEYPNGKLGTAGVNCPSFEQVSTPEQSLPPGCLAQVANAVPFAGEPPCFEELE